MNSFILEIMSFIFMMNVLFLMVSMSHLLMVLLVFELVGLKFLMFYIVLSSSVSKSVGLVFLVLVACEASLGLSVLMGMVRYNYLSYVNSNKIFNI